MKYIVIFRGQSTIFLLTGFYEDSVAFGDTFLNINHLDPIKAILEQIGYDYDANGNRTKMDRLNITPKLPSPEANISYNAANQMLTFNNKSVAYNANGNMTTITTSCGTTSHTWDARNRLSSISGFNSDCSALSASFKYDALGRRIEKTVNNKTTDYLYDGLDIVQEIENGAVSANYLRTLRIDEPLARIKSDGTIRYYQADALGSIVALTDENGTTKTQYNYDPFGNSELIGETSDNPFQYTGRENDGTGLYYYRARYYSPELHRFISEDPIGLAGGINQLAYVGNAPTNKRDPLGLWKSAGHTALTQSAMSSFGVIFSNNDISAANYANKGVDLIVNQMSNAAHYMPRSQNEAETLISMNLKNAIQLEVAGNHIGAMTALGIGLHILQDRSAHYEQNAGMLRHFLEMFSDNHPDNANSHAGEFAMALSLSKAYLSIFLNEVKRSQCK